VGERRTPSAPSEEERDISMSVGLTLSQLCGMHCRPDKSVVIKAILRHAREGWTIWEEKPESVGSLRTDSLWMESLARGRISSTSWSSAASAGPYIKTNQSFSPAAGLEPEGPTDDMRLHRELLSGRHRMGLMCQANKWRRRELCACIRPRGYSPPAIQKRIQGPDRGVFRITGLPPCLTNRYFSAQAPECSALIEAGVEPLFQLYEAQPVEALGALLQRNWWPWRIAREQWAKKETNARQSRILCDKLEHTQANLARLSSEMRNS